MKKYRAAFLAVVCLTAPAHALEVSNLDSVDHRVLFESAGSQQVYPVKAGETVYIVGQTSGMLSLLTAENPKPSKGTLHSDGLLSGIVGAERTSDIPADMQDIFAIWPGGKIGIQGHRKNGRFNS